jgi:putative flippase GtrA
VAQSRSRIIPCSRSLGSRFFNLFRIKASNHIQLYKFIAVGILNTIFGYSLYSALLLANIHYSIASALATVFGVIFNFKTSGYYVFKSKNNKLILKFVILYIFLYIVNVCAIYLMVKFGLTPFIGGAIMILPCAILSFILQKKFVFN